MKRAIPFGERILVRRKKIGETRQQSAILLTEQTLDRATDLATVEYLPDLSFADKALIDNAEKIINSMTNEAIAGSPHALDTLLRYNQYLKLKSLKVGDEVFLNKYVGTDYYDSNAKGTLTVVAIEDIYGVIIKVPDLRPSEIITQQPDLVGENKYEDDMQDVSK